MRPSGIELLYTQSHSHTKSISTTEEERIARLYPPEVVHSRYWKGGLVSRNVQPHEVDATPSEAIQHKDWTIRSLYPILPGEFKRIVVIALMMRNRKDCVLSVFPVEVLLYLLEFAIPVKTFKVDKQGLFDWLSQIAKCTNPPTKLVTCSASSIDSGSPDVLLDRNGGSGYTKPIPNSWVKANLAPSGYRLCCTHYRYSARRFGGTPRALRNWEFQGSNDGLNWVIIRKHVEDDTIPDISGGTATFEVDSKCHFYSQFRIVQTGPNAYRETSLNHWQDNYAQLNFGNMELWGCIFESNNEQEDEDTPEDTPYETKNLNKANNFVYVV